MTYAWARHTRATGAANGSSQMSTAPARTNGRTCATVVSVHSRPMRCSRAASTRGRQYTAAVSGRTPGATSGGAAAANLASRDGLAQDDGVRAHGELADLLGLPGPVVTIAR